MTYTVDPRACRGCGLCVDVCPVKAIALERGCARIDASLCTGCGACEVACPVAAISRAGRPDLAELKRRAERVQERLSRLTRRLESLSGARR
jgi:ferredoxin